MSLVNAALNDRWNSVPLLTTLYTPSERKSLTVWQITPDEMHISTEGGTEMKITRSAFSASLNYLLEQGHVASHPCAIASDQLRSEAGPLCLAARDANSESGGTRVITYVLPILKEMGLVEINSEIPNTVWLT